MERSTIRIENSTDHEPALTWTGKRQVVQVGIPKLHLLEDTCANTREGQDGQTGGNAVPNLLLHGDNLEILAWLLDRGYCGRVRLIYLDPPFDSDNNYASSVRLRGSGQVVGQQVQYADRWQGSDYLQFMLDRLLLLRELLHPDGVLWLHCDHRANAALFLLLQEVFGAESCLNTISWRSQVARGAKVHARYFPRSTHFLHIFARSPRANPIWHAPRKEIVMTREEAAARYMEDDNGFFRTSHPGTYSFASLVELHQAGRIYAPYKGDVVVDEEAERVYGSNGGNIGIKYYVEERGRDRFVVTRAVDNLWDDIPGLGTIPSQDVNYPTQKTEGLLQRIMETSTDPGDLVLDPFVGSGTTAAVAQRLGRTWIGCDDAWGAIRTTANRVWREEMQPVPVQIYQLEDIESPAGDGQIQVEIEQGEDGPQVVVQGYTSQTVSDVIASAEGDPPQMWQALVQSVAIDPDYDGHIFRPAMVDAPAGREATVAGQYRLSPCVEGQRVAVQVVDVLGQESLVVRPLNVRK